MYITYEEYTALYDSIEEKVFNRICYDACKCLDRHTTGADGVKKLKAYFPSASDSAESVRRCAAEVVYIMAQIYEAEKSASVGRVYVPTENGIRGNIISSVSAGGESIAYSNEPMTVIDTAISDPVAQNNLVAQIIRKHLSGAVDANGVGLLYMGEYPV